MSGERPVPVGNLDTSCSDRNQYLETGELNQQRRPARPRTLPPPSERGDRDNRHSTSASSNAGFAMSNPYMDSGPPEFDDRRPWSRNDHYERDFPPGPGDYPYGSREPHYGYMGEFGAGRRPIDPYYRDRGYSGPYRPNQHDFYDAPPYGAAMYNTSRREYGSLPRRPTGNPEARQQQEILKEFSVRDPAGYKEWYSRFKAHKMDPRKYPMPPIPGYMSYGRYQSNYSQNHLVDRMTTPFEYTHPSDDRYEQDGGGKVPSMSGRSSRNGSSFHQGVHEGRLDSFRTYDRESPPIDTITTTETPPDRLTPQKFRDGHAIGVITPFGHLLRVSGGSRTVEIHHVKTLMKDLPEYHELESFPGPLIRGRTHKNTVIKFCEKKIKAIQNQDFQTDKENLILLWELLILLIRQNGSVVGSDIAELLLKKKGKVDSGSAAESESNNSEVEEDGDDGDGDSGVSTALPLSPNDPKTTQKFCDLLLFGHKADALEYAMSKGLWGHALFLASKLGEREYGQVMARFANGLAHNHPLQTLYQIMSSRVPSAVTGCLDESFGDWRPHLAMIISNAGIRPEIEQKAFSKLGDTLRNKNLIYASQFCHLMAQSTFSEDSKLGPLLGLAPNGSNVLEATQMTEIYEFAMSLADSQFNLGTGFLRAKFDYVRNLIDFGFTFQAFSYCEGIAKHLRPSNSKNDLLRWDLVQVGERLKHVDVSTNSDWIEELRSELESKTAETSDSSSRRPSSTGASSTTDQQTPPNVPIVPETPGLVDYAPSYNICDMDNPGSTVDSEPNAVSFAPGAIPMIPVSEPPNPVINQPNPVFDPNNGQAWNTGLELNQPTLRAWESNGPYFTPNSPLTQEKLQHLPPEPRPPGENNVNSSKHPYHPQSNPYDYSVSNGQTPQPLRNTSAPQSSQPLPALNDKSIPNAKVKRKTVTFEDEEGEMSGRMSRSQALNILSRGESDEVTEETSEEEGESLPHQLPVQFKSTYPIDAPLGRRLFTNTNGVLRTSKVSSAVRTYPVDEKCCDASEPCFDHSLPKSLLPSSPSARPNLNSARNPEIESQWKNDEKKVAGENNGKKKVESKPNAGNKGGILSWLGLRGKNQMILPEDKEPAIVWDDAKKMWVNTKEDEDDSSGPRGPPPKDSELMKSNGPPQQQHVGFAPPPQMPLQMDYGQGPPSFNPQLQQPTMHTRPQENWTTQALSQGPPSFPYQNSPNFQSSSGSQSLNMVQQPQPPPLTSGPLNKYKLQKSGRGGMRGKYVDIFSGSTTGPQPNVMAPPSMAPISGNGLFVPGPSAEPEDYQEQQR